MSSREIVLAQIRHEETRPVPYTLGFEEGVAEKLDAFLGSDEWRRKIVPFMAVVDPVDTTREEWIDEVHKRDAFGSLWRCDRRPYHIVEPAMREPSFDDYEFPGPDRFLEPARIEKARAELEAHPDRFRVVGMGWGLFEQSWRIRGFENALIDAAAEPDFYTELLGRLKDLYRVFLDACADLPADAVLFGDDWGDQRGVILGPERWRQLLKPLWAELYEVVHAQGKIVISHCCGSVAEIMDDIIEIGLDVLESVQPEAAGMSPYELKKRYGDRIAFWGGLGSQSTIPFGTPDEIRAEVARLRSKMAKGGGYILSPAKALQPETPPENMAALVEAFTEQEI